MEKQQKKQIRKYISWAVLAGMILILDVMPLLAEEKEISNSPTASILSGTVGKADIDTSICGGGVLSSEKAVKVEIPAEVKLTEYLVGNGDLVSEGDPIAYVDRISVMAAITQVQETMDLLAEEIDAAHEENASESVRSRSDGTVKIIYAQEGDKAEDVMLEHGALAVLSLDGYMAVQIQRNTSFAAGDAVAVTLADGSETEGKVESNFDGILTVKIKDNGYTPGETVLVTTEEGTRIGAGELYIHSQWNATAYSGTVSSIRVKEGDMVYADNTLMTLKDTGHSPKYQQLINQRRDYEEVMLQLFRMYHTETVTAPCDGIVSGVDTNGNYMLAASQENWKLTLLSGATGTTDPTGGSGAAAPMTYTGYVAHVQEAAIDSLILKVNRTLLTLADLADLSSVPMDTSAMSEDLLYWGSQNYVDATLTEIGTAQKGDILLFLADSNGNTWILKVGYEEVGTEEPEKPDSPDAPEGPSGKPEDSETGEMKPGGMGGSMPSMGGGIGVGGFPQEDTLNTYPLDMLTIASVTSQEKMTVEISVDEMDITKLWAGQEATVTLDALPGQQFQAVVKQIGSSGESNGGNSKFAVTLVLEKNADMLPGMSVSAVITLETVADCISVPVAALNELNNQTVIYTAYDSETDTLKEPVPVVTGVSDGENVQILSGAEEGLIFYYPYYDTLVISSKVESGRFSFGR